MTNETINEFDIDGLEEGAYDKRETVYPRLQWFSGSQKLKGKKLFESLGGFLVPQKEQGKATSLPQWESTNIAFDRGNSEECLVCQRTRLVVIRSRELFCRTVDGRDTDFALRWREGLKSKTQHLVLLEGCEQLFSFNVKSTTSGAFWKGVSAHTTNVVNQANASAPRPLPPYAFWMNVVPSDYITVGSGDASKIVTQPALELPDKVSREFLVRQFVGKEAVLHHQSLYKETQAWADAWKDVGALSAQPDDDAWACGPDLQTQFEALLAQMTQGESDLVRGYMEEAMVKADADQLSHIPAGKMREILGAWRVEQRNAVTSAVAA